MFYKDPDRFHSGNVLSDYVIDPGVLQCLKEFVVIQELRKNQSKESKRNEEESI